MTKYTENQTAVLANVDLSEGSWFEDIVTTVAEQGLNKDKKQARVTLNQLIKKGTLGVDTTREEGESWVYLQEQEQEPWFRSEQGLNLVAGPDPVISESAALQQSLSATYTVPAEEAPEEEEDDLIGDVQPEEAPAAEIPTAERTEQTDLYTVREWKDEDEVEWTETAFHDNSRTIKRRKLVSGSWRTDYWGAEFEGDKERYTTAKLVKMARAYGTFKHNPGADDLI